MVYVTNKACLYFKILYNTAVYNLKKMQNVARAGLSTGLIAKTNLRAHIGLLCGLDQIINLLSFPTCKIRIIILTEPISYLLLLRRALRINDPTVL